MNSFKDAAENEAKKEISQLYAWGLNEALSLMWSDTVNREGIPLFKSTPELNRWADSVLQCCGRLRMIEQFFELERLKLARITAVKDGVAHCYLDCPGLGSESVERHDGEFISQLVYDDNESRGVWNELEARKPEVLNRMKGLVGTFHGHYIRYDADPLVDDYYSDFADATAGMYSGWDSFSPDAKFGGVPFHRYVGAVTHLIGFARKHLDFCALLCSKFPQISPMDILSLPCKWSDACEYMSWALECSSEEASQIMASTALTDANVVHHLRLPASAPALHYMIGKGSSVRLIHGCLSNPFEFMLRELKRKYESDWNRSVDDREHMFRNLLISAFSGFNGRILVFGDSVNIKSDLGATDIDVFAFDPFALVAGFFQVKWQDPFGSSMRERESRKTNFLKHSNEWVKKVSRWIEQGKMAQTLISIGIPRHAAENVKDTKIFVLGRHYSHFSGECWMDERAAWGTFPQLLRLLHTPAKGASPLTLLHDLIKKDSPHKRLPQQNIKQEYSIDGLKLVVHSGLTVREGRSE